MRMTLGEEGKATHIWKVDQGDCSEHLALISVSYPSHYPDCSHIWTLHVNTLRAIVDITDE